MLCAEYGGLTRILLVKKLLESCEITDFDYKHLNIFKMGKDSPIGGCVGDKPRRYEGN